MSTKKPRIHITMSSEATELLTTLATQENKSLSGIALELILEALDRREDLALYTIAQARDQKKAKMVRHEEAWQ